MSPLGDKLKVLRFNSDLEGYKNKKFIYSELYDILPLRRRKNAYENKILVNYKEVKNERI